MSYEEEQLVFALDHLMYANVVVHFFTSYHERTNNKTVKQGMHDTFMLIMRNGK